MAHRITKWIAENPYGDHTEHDTEAEAIASEKKNLRDGREALVANILRQIGPRSNYAQRAKAVVDALFPELKAPEKADNLPPWLRSAAGDVPPSLLAFRRAAKGRKLRKTRWKQGTHISNVRESVRGEVVADIQYGSGRGEQEGFVASIEDLQDGAWEVYE